MIQAKNALKGGTVSKSFPDSQNGFEVSFLQGKFMLKGSRIPEDPGTFASELWELVALWRDSDDISFQPRGTSGHFEAML